MTRVARPSLVAFLVLLAGVASGQDEEPLLPDLIVRRSDLFDRRIDTEEIPGRTLLRFSNGTVNVGRGQLHLYGVLPGNPDGTQDVMQRVFYADGSFEDRRSGEFEFHVEHDHIHLEGFALYRLRAVLPDDGVGEVIVEAEKTSFCIVDLLVYDRTLPNFRPVAEFRNCNGVVQGLSVGWADVYDETLPGQVLDITGLRDGEYWLESTVDPDDAILEVNEDNNVTRVKITIGDPNNSPDPYEPNDTIEDVDERPAGGPYSPNLGPCNPKRVVDGLNLLLEGDDYFKFYSNEVGGPGDFVRIDFQSRRGNLDIALLDAAGNEVETSEGDDDVEVISLQGKPEGWYYVRVWGRDGATNTGYRLVVNPPQNEPPSLVLLTPPAGDAKKIHGADSYTITWKAVDPENDQMWVSAFLNDHPVLDGSMTAISTARLVEADIGLAVINSAEYEPGTYWVFCAVTDGGSTAGVWAVGTVTFLEFDAECRIGDVGDPDCNVNRINDDCEIAAGVAEDCNLNGVPDACDIDTGSSRDRDDNGVPDECDAVFHRGDANDDGKLDISDPLRILSFLFLDGAEISCRESADADNDGGIAINDGLFLLNFLFSDGRPPADPGPPPAPCGPDPDQFGSPGFLGCEVSSGC